MSKTKKKKKNKVSIEDIGEMLEFVGFTKKYNNRNYPSELYEFEHKYPELHDRENHYSHLYISFDDYEDDIYIYIHVHNIHGELKLSEVKSVEDVLYEIDGCILSGRQAWIYYHRGFSHFGPSATEQRKRYFEKRMKMRKYKLDDEIRDEIKEYGLEHVTSDYDLEYKGKKILDMNWDELAEALAKMIKKEQKK